jgi:CheY-like chemotaxis protein
MIEPKPTNISNLPILLIEDDPISLSIIKAFIGHLGLTADEATDGLDAFNKMVTRRYAAILIDVEMPILNGIQTTALIRLLGHYPQHQHLLALPIIALTAAQDQETIQACNTAGMNEILYKPISPKQLLSSLSTHIAAFNVSTATEQHDLSKTIMGSELTQKLTMLNTEEAITRIGGSETAYRRQLARFAKNHRNAAQILSQYLITGNSLTTAHYCHALRGVLSNLGDTQITPKLREVEHDIKTKQPISEIKITNISNDINKLLAEIAQLTPLKTVKPIETTMAHLSHLKEQLRCALAHDISHATPIVEQLTVALKNSMLYPQIQQIATDVELFNIEGAINALDRLDLTDLDNGKQYE